MCLHENLKGEGHGGEGEDGGMDVMEEMEEMEETECGSGDGVDWGGEGVGNGETQLVLCYSFELFALCLLTRFLKRAVWERNDKDSTRFEDSSSPGIFFMWVFVWRLRLSRVSSQVQPWFPPAQCKETRVTGRCAPEDWTTRSMSNPPAHWHPSQCPVPPQ